jgi:hypothetical protein
LNENGISEIVLSLDSVDYDRMIVGAIVFISMIVGMSIRIHLSSKRKSKRSLKKDAR